MLSATGTTVYNNTYINDFKVSKLNGFYTQSGGTVTQPIFTREIRVEYTENTNADAFLDSNDAKMKVTAIVQWQDPGSPDIKKVEMDTLLTNWKK